jgi:hypothetical protein
MPYQGCLTVVHRTWGKLHHQVSKLKCWAVCVAFPSLIRGSMTKCSKTCQRFLWSSFWSGQHGNDHPHDTWISQATNRLDVPSYPRVFYGFLTSVPQFVQQTLWRCSHFGAPFRRLFFIGRIQGANQRLNSPWRKVGGPCLPCWAGLHWALVHVTWSPFRWR